VPADSRPENEANCPPEPHGKAGAWRSRHLALFSLAILLSIALLIPIAFQWRTWWSGDFTNRYAPNPQWSGLAAPALVGCLIVALVCGAVAKAGELADPKKGRAVTATLVGLLVLLTFILHVATVVFLGEFSLAGASWPFFQRLGEGAYHVVANQVEGAGPFLRGFESRFLRVERDPLLPHLDTHPPGIIFVFYGLRTAFEAVPSLAQWLEQTAAGVSPILQETLVDAAAGSQVFKHGLAVSLSAAMVCFLTAALAPAAAYLLSREFASRPAALVVAGICALFPGCYCFNPGFEQCQATPALLLCLCVVRAFRTRSAVWGALGGLVLFAGLGCTLAFIVPLGMLLAAGMLCLLAMAGPVDNRLERIRRLLPTCAVPCLGVLAGILVPGVLLIVLYDFNLLTVLALCQRNNAAWHHSVGNRYWPWAFTNLVEMLYSMGVPAFFALFATLVAGVARRGKEGLLRPETSFCWGVQLTFLLLCVSAVNRGEVARLWLFLFPVLWSAASVGLDPVLRPGGGGSGQRWRLVALVLAMALQTAYVVVVSTSVDPLETAKTFHNVLDKMRPGT
jgi:hypothetical protein